MLADRLRMTSKVPLAGQQAYTTAGDYTFTVPAGVTSISVLCVGGGGGGAFLAGDGGHLAYKNNISVSAGQTYTVTVGPGGDGGLPSFFTQGGAGEYSVFRVSGGGTVLVRARGGQQTALNNIGDASYSGGSGFSSGNTRQGGGGAAGYAGAGGAGGFDTYFYGGTGDGSSGNGGGGGGGGGGAAYIDGDFFYSYAGGSGGGVGILGQGTSGTGGAAEANGNPGSGGSGKVYGGGGACGSYIADIPTDTITDQDPGAAGGVGAVRIIWGADRSYPSNAGNV